MSFLSIFIKDTYMFGKYIHCDLHDANWKVLKLKRITHMRQMKLLKLLKLMILLFIK